MKSPYVSLKYLRAHITIYGLRAWAGNLQQTVASSLKDSAEVSFLPFAKDILSPDCVEAAVVHNMDKHLEQHLEFVSSSKQEA